MTIRSLGTGEVLGVVPAYVAAGRSPGRGAPSRKGRWLPTLAGRVLFADSGWSPAEWALIEAAQARRLG